MIIIHNPHDRTSREFVEEFGEGHIIYDIPACLDLYPAVPGGPCVIVLVPAYRDPDTGMDVEAYDHVYAFPADMGEVDAFVEMVQTRAAEHPYGGGEP